MQIKGKTVPAVSNVDLNRNESKRLRDVAEDFEAIFLSFMLKSILKISSEDKLVFGGDNFGADILDGIFMLELSKHIAKSGKFGIAELVCKQLEIDKFEDKGKVGSIENISNKNITSSENTRRRVKKTTNGYGESLLERINRFDGIIKEASSKFNVSEELVKAIIAVESSGNIFASSPKGAKGLMQIVDSTAQFVGVKNVWHPAENIYGGVKYLRYLLDRFNGDIKLVLAGYNAGPENVEKFGGIPPFPETIEYVGKVMRYLKIFEQSKNHSNDEQ